MWGLLQLRNVYPRFKSLKFTAIWVVRRTWCSPFQGDFRAIVFLTDFKSERWEKIGNISLVSHSQIFEETGRIQDPAQFTGI